MRGDGLPELRKDISGFSVKESEAEANHRGWVRHSRAAAGGSKEYPEEKSAAFDYRS